MSAKYFACADSEFLAVSISLGSAPRRLVEAFLSLRHLTCKPLMTATIGVIDGLHFACGLDLLPSQDTRHCMHGKIQHWAIEMLLPPLHTGEVGTPLYLYMHASLSSSKQCTTSRKSTTHSEDRTGGGPPRLSGNHHQIICSSCKKINNFFS